MPLSIFSNKLRALPKAELHCHLDGSVRPATLLDLAHESRIQMPKHTAEELGEFMRVDDALTLEDYLRRFDVTISVMQSEEALERIAYELAEDAVEDGIRYIEVRNAPILNVVKGLTLVQAVEAPLRGLRRAENDFGIIGRFIICGLRQFSPDNSLEMAQLAVEFKDDGVVAFDLAGGEKGNPAAHHVAAFRYAREHNLAVTVHAGEGDGAESVAQAVHVCGANRIGHGTRLIEDADLTQYVNDRRIALEVCLTSNVQTRVADSYATHPLREYFDRGLNVTLNTDNRLMSGTTLTDEYVHAAEHLGFTVDELAGIALNGFESAFLPWEERLMLIEEASDKIEELIGVGRMKSEYSTDAAIKAAKAIRKRADSRNPGIAIILGSGLGGLSKSIGGAVRIPFGDIPNFPEATVAGHEGAVIIGSLGGRDIVALSGRFHMYEGHPAVLAAFPVRVFHALGARDLFVSNAAGGISSRLAVGDLMIISDHLNLMGTNPLVGEAQEGETRFPDMTDAYDPGFRRLLRTSAEKLGIKLREGVYAGLLGPSYETPSEIKMLKLLGADAVGMSTVPEVIMARALGMRVAGVSCITNAAAGVTGAALSHAEVLETTNRVSAAFESLVTEFLALSGAPQLSAVR